MDVQGGATISAFDEAFRQVSPEPKIEIGSEGVGAPVDGEDAPVDGEDAPVGAVETPALP